MKKLRFLIVILSIGLFTLNSCQDNGPVTNPQPEATKSIALRTVLNKLKQTNNITGRIANTSRVANTSDENDFCFEFVYPFQLEYNDGTLVAVENFAGLMQILASETNELYIVGIVFPFDIVLTADGSTVTINNEADFIEVLQNCQMDVWDEEDVIVDDCFEFVYPFDIIDGDGNTVSISSEDDLETFFASQNPQYYEPNFVYPITVINSEGEEVVIESIYDFYDIVDDCYDCECPDIEDPVCVLVDATSGEVVEYDNACEAICEGYTPMDFVNCDDEDYDCNIDNIEVEVGDCNDSGVYDLTFNFTYNGAPSDSYFNVFTRDSTYIEQFTFADLPVTLQLGGSIFEDDFILINEVNNPNCWEDEDWETPSCATVDIFFMDYVGSCYDIVYPIEVSFQGVTYEVFSFAQLQQYFNPQNMGEIHFPIQIEVIATGETITIESMDELEEFINENCD